MSADPVQLAMARRDQRAGMRSTVTIESVEEQFNDTTGETDTVVTATHYTGRALVTPMLDRLIEVEAGDGQAGMVLYRVVIDEPSSAPPREARVTVDASPDGALVGRVLWVFDFEVSDHLVNRVLIARETR